MVVGDDEVQTLTGFQRPCLAISRIVEEMRIMGILHKQMVACILRRTAPTNIEVYQLAIPLI